MADDKSKKTAADKKIADVKKGGDASAGTSRQIIINNRPIMKDPMMAEVTALTNAEAGVKSDAEAPKAETPGAPVVSKREKTVAVTHADDTPEAAEAKESPDPAPEKIEVKKPKKVAIKPLSDSAPEPAKPAGESDKTASAEPTLAAEASEEAPADDAAGRSEPPAVPEEEPGKEDAKPTTAPANETKAPDDETKPAAPNGAAQPGRSFDETEQSAESPLPPADDAAAKPKPAPKQPGELTAEQQKAVDKEVYFLPITTAETKRMRREILLTTLFIIIVLAAWLDIMLDAGLLHFSGVHALTHFFNS